MVEQAPAGWYPDGQGNERYWDGTGWTNQIRTPAQPVLPVESQTKREGAFSRLGTAVKKVAADQQAQREERLQKQADARHAAGDLVTSAEFARVSVEVYSGGFVRVAQKINANTPYEKLISIKYEPPKSENNRGEASVGVAGLASLAKGGLGVLKKGSGLTDLVAAGVQEVVASRLRESVLTISTDREIHTLIDEGGTGRATIGRALEAAGSNAIPTSMTVSHTLATRGVFGGSAVEIYEEGFVRVAANIYNSTPYEKLRSITFAQPEQGNGSPLGATLANGAAAATGFMKGRVPGLVSVGLRKLGASEPGKYCLTVTSDQEIHTLMDSGGPGVVELGTALEAAGNVVINRANTGHAQSSADTGEAAPPSAARPSVGERIRELAALHQDGILSDDEFTTAKANLLAGL
jgi:hypothetical protein